MCIRDRPISHRCARNPEAQCASRAVWQQPLQRPKQHHMPASAENETDVLIQEAASPDNSQGEPVLSEA
eukprot:7347408-Alexandrium_andersonii.AAC.1